MMNIPYNISRRLGYVMCGIIPVFVVFVLLLLGLSFIESFIVACFLGFVLPLVTSWVGGRNPFIQTLSKGLILVFDVNSTGIANMYNAQAINETKDKIDIEIDFGNRKEVRSYDRRLVKRFSFPRPAFLQFAKKSSGEEVLELRVDKKRYEEAVFGNQYFTVLFYNSETGMLLTKPSISDVEKALMVEMINMDLLRETRLLNRTMRDFMRYTFDVIMNKVRGLLQSKGFQFIVVIVIVMVIILIAIMFWPTFSKMFFSSGEVAGQAANTGIQSIAASGGSA